MADRTLHSPAFLSQLISYDPLSGILTWLPRTLDMFASNQGRAANACAIWNSKHAGRPISTCSEYDYVRFTCMGCQMLGHRVAWALTHGYWPMFLDHINGDRTDNRIANLREATIADNNRNLARRYNNKSGHTGISASRGKWRVTISHAGKALHIGEFHSLEAAVAARQAAAEKYGYHVNHGRVKTTP